MKRDVLVKTLSGTSPPQDGKYVVHSNNTTIDIQMINFNVITFYARINI